MKMPKHIRGYYKEIGEDDESLAQIERCVDHCVYTLISGNTPEKIISRMQALELLGEEDFWSGIDRAAFHTDAIRDVANTPAHLKVCFNCHDWLFA